ncbi:MAG: acetolactate synthase large subunit, partial [Myxococcota bacterium]
TTDIHSLATPVSAWVRRATSGKHLAEDMAEAIAASRSTGGQVATLIIPADYQAEEGGGPVDAHTPIRAAQPDSARVEEVARRARDARTTALLLGGTALGESGLRAAARVAASSRAVLLGETFPARVERGAGLPVVERLPYFPEQAVEALSGFELVILAGAKEPVAFFAYEGAPSRLAPQEALLELAGPEEDSVAALESLADALGAAPDAGQCASRSLPAPPTGRLNPASIGAALARALPENAIVVDEAATSGLPFYPASVGAARHTLLSLTGGAIGQGLPCASGAALACPDRKVIAFQADGSAQYTLQSLWTQARENLNVLTLLCSNRSYRILLVELGRAGIVEPGPQARALTSLADPELDWVALARGYGVPGERIESAEELAASLPRALAEPGPRLLELML